MSFEMKKDFPALHDGCVSYLDHAATTQLPDVVLKAIESYERGGRGNPGRGLHGFAARASYALEQSRETLARFVGASVGRVIFTKSTTESLNLVARSLGSTLGPEDEVVMTVFEHHANVLPWRALAAERGFTLRVLPMTRDGGVSVESAKTVFSPRTKVFIATLVSNVTGAILPVAELSQMAKAYGALVIVDAAQAVGHIPVHMSSLGCDALAFGAHKMYGPSGIGALAVSDRLWEVLRPFVLGGGMVEEVADAAVTYVDDVRLFEAGSPNVSGAVGFAAAAEYLLSLGLKNILTHERMLTGELLDRLTEISKLTVYGPADLQQRTGIVSFALGDVHPHDIAHVLAESDVMVRAGYHCAAPLTRCLHPAGTVRVSIGLPNTLQDIERLIGGLDRVRKIFG